MRSLLLRVVAQALLPVSTLFAIYLLVRGHDAPGGGFIAGLVTTLAIVLEAIAFGTGWTRRQLAAVIRPAFVVGLGVATVAGLLPLLVGEPFLTHYHFHLPLPGGVELEISTALFFDVGVYLVVVGTTSTALTVLAEDA
jgi:multisubunit Na+/H+ antiporter MnhB subunit